MYDSNYTGMVVLDFQKDFDTIVHDILITKLRATGIASIEWLKYYLSNRKQIVIVNRVESKPRDVIVGVPQGNVLGHLLFICYVNYVSIRVNCKWLLYANDIAYRSGKDEHFIYLVLSYELVSCNEGLID